METQTPENGSVGTITIKKERSTLDNAVIEAFNRPACTVTEDSAGDNIN